MAFKRPWIWCQEINETRAVVLLSLISKYERYSQESTACFIYFLCGFVALVEICYSYAIWGSDNR